MIELSLKGAEKIAIDEDGNLALTQNKGLVYLHRPVVYQDTEDGRQEVPGRFVLRGEARIGFELGSYDETRVLVIDPVIEYSTFFGANGEDTVWDIAVDYLGFGPVFPSSSVETGFTPRGVELLAQAVERAGRPVVAIGGICAQNLTAVVGSGAAAAAMISAIANAPDPAAATRELTAFFG